MSEVGGIYHLDGQPVNKEALATLMAAQKAYGAEGSTVWRGESVGLGHQMTFVTPDARDERLPWYDESSQLAITADARLDNREELFNALAIRGQARAMADSQLIVRAYQKWGTDCPRHLLGDLAFAIWDGRARQLFCARDHCGIKPFYYHEHQGTNKHFVFASDIEALLAAPLVPYRLNICFLASHLQSFGMRRDAESTGWQQIKKLPAAHAMTISRRGIKKWSYWQPAEGPVWRFKSEDEYAEMLLELLKEAIRCRLPNAPVGSHLSGGLVSSAMTVLAARQMRERNQPLTAFSWSPVPKEDEEISQDERVLVKLVAEAESLPYHYTTLTKRAILRQRLRPFDQAQHRLSHESIVQEQAHQLGISVLLSGVGLNYMMWYSGQGYLPELFWRGQVRQIVAQLPHIAAREKKDIYRTAYNKLLLPLLPDQLYFRWQRLRGRLRSHPSRRPPSKVLPWLKPDISRQVLECDTPTPAPWRERGGVYEHRLARFTSKITQWAPARASMGIEYRYPFLDRRLIDFCFRLPPEMLIKNGSNRYLFRHAMQGILPDEVRWGKRTFGLAPQPASLSQAWQIEALFPILSAHLSHSQSFHYLDQQRISDMLTTHAAGGNQKEKPMGLLTALQIELMANQALFDSIKSIR